MKTGTLILVGIVLATIAYQVVERIPADTLSVALGAACGFAASIPVTVGLMLALLRQRQTPDTIVETSEAEPAPTRIYNLPAPQTLNAPPLQTPQIIVLAPQGQFAPGQLPQGFPLPAQWTNMPNPFMHEQATALDAREWRIIGEE